MKVKVKQHFGGFRYVDVPDARLSDDIDDNLELVFTYGQNEVQPQDRPSLMAGDIIYFNDDQYLITFVGFKLLR